MGIQRNGKHWDSHLQEIPSRDLKKSGIQESLAKETVLGSKSKGALDRPFMFTKRFSMQGGGLFRSRGKVGYPSGEKQGL